LRRQEWNLSMNRSVAGVWSKILRLRTNTCFAQDDPRAATISRNPL
jgi:hypothetical protein